MAVDLVLLDDAIDVGVVRGAPATHPKYEGRRIFGSGINLTHLYHGKISLVEFMIERELGGVSKMYRGHSTGHFEATDLEERREKPWIAAVDTFAIGGACQWLLVMDRVVAETGSYFNLPARKEGIIPGSANLRLPRFVGEGLTRQAIFFGYVFEADSPEGRMIAAEVVPSAEIDAAVDARPPSSRARARRACSRTARRCGSATSHSTCSVATWPRTRASRRTACTAPRSSRTSSATGTRKAGDCERRPSARRPTR